MSLDDDQFKLKMEKIRNCIDTDLGGVQERKLTGFNNVVNFIVKLKDINTLDEFYDNTKNKLK